MRKTEDWSAFVRFLAVGLLHPLAGIGVRDLYSPVTVANARASEEGVDKEVIAPCRMT